MKSSIAVLAAAYQLVEPPTLLVVRSRVLEDGEALAAHVLLRGLQSAR